MINKKTKISEEFTTEVMDSVVVINHLLKRIKNLEDEFLDVKVKEIEDLKQEIFELKTEIYLVNISLKYLRFGIVILTLPILWDISVKIVKLFA